MNKHRDWRDDRIDILEAKVKRLEQEAANRESGLMWWYDACRDAWAARDKYAAEVEALEEEMRDLTSQDCPTCHGRSI